MKKLIYILLLLVACNEAPKKPAPQSSTRSLAPTESTGIFAPGNGYYFGDGTDFNAAYGFKEGDTVRIPAGTYQYFDFHCKMKGLVFVNEGGQVISDNINFGPQVVNCKLIGNLTPGFPYGFKVTSKDRFGLGFDCLGDIEISGVESVGNIIGIQLVSPQPYRDSQMVKTPGIYQNLYLHDCLVRNSIQEAVYLGYYILGGIFMRARVERVKVRSSGADAIQCRNGFFEVYDCDADSIGVSADANNSQFLQFGGNTNGSIAKRNIGRNVAGLGIFCNGFGNFLFECNDIQSGNSSVFTKNYEPEQDLQKVGFQAVQIKNNTLYSKNGKAFEHYYHSTGVPVTITADNNKTAGLPYLETGVKFTGTGNAPGTVVQCSSAPPTPTVFHKGYILINSKRFYYTMYVSGKDSTFKNKK